ncbi:MAG: alpha/beta hydrolase [Acidobacteria bacterium]|nr:alpha/beta hydrolase [Acidobacteriota bacterium]
MPTVTTPDGCQLFVKDWGAGRPVVMLHGWPLSADTFDDLAMTLADAGLRAIAYDRRGFGRSQQSWQGYDYDTLADDLAAVIDATGADDITLLGFSMGGGEVARYLTRHGQARVRQAILVSSVVPYMLKTDDNPAGVEPRVFDGMATSMRADRAKFWTSFFADFYGVGVISQPVSDEVLAWSAAMAMQASVKATLACAAAFATTDFRADLASFTVPTLVIHGTKDRTVPIDTSARPAAAAIPGSILLEYDGAPHGLFASHKQELARDVLTFVTGGDPRVTVPVDTIPAGALPYPLDPSIA